MEGDEWLTTWLELLEPTGLKTCSRALASKWIRPLWCRDVKLGSPAPATCRVMTMSSPLSSPSPT